MGLRFYYFLLIFYFNYVISLNILKSSRNFFLDKKGIETEASTLIGSVIEFVPDFNFQILDKCDNYFILIRIHLFLMTCSLICDIVDKRSHNTSGGQIYLCTQGYLDNLLFTLQNDV